MVPPSRRRKAVSLSPAQATKPARLESRLARMEALLEARANPTFHPSPPTPNAIGLGNDQPDPGPLRRGQTTSTPSDSTSRDAAPVQDHQNAPASFPRMPTRIQHSWNGLDAVSYPAPTDFLPAGTSASSEILSNPSPLPNHPVTTLSSYAPGPEDAEESVIQLQSVNWEHHGPGSWVSICSPPGVKWVCETTGTSDFIDSAKLLVHTWCSRLTIKSNPVAGGKRPEPDAVAAWLYTSGMLTDLTYSHRPCCARGR